MQGKAGRAFNKDAPWNGVADERFTALPAREECALLDSWRTERDAGAMRKLLAAYLPFAERAACKVRSRYLDRDDRQGAALDALVRAIERIPERGVGCGGSLKSWHQYLALRTQQAVIDEHRKLRGRHGGNEAGLWEERTEDVVHARRMERHLLRRDIFKVAARAGLKEIEADFLKNEMEEGTWAEFMKRHAVPRIKVQRTRLSAFTKVKRFLQQ